MRSEDTRVADALHFVDMHTYGTIRQPLNTYVHMRDLMELAFFENNNNNKETQEKQGHFVEMCTRLIQCGTIAYLRQAKRSSTLMVCGYTLNTYVHMQVLMKLAFFEKTNKQQRGIREVRALRRRCVRE